MGHREFVPIDTTGKVDRHPATGDIQPDGSYQMWTFRRGDGVRPDKYAIAVQPRRVWKFLTLPSRLSP